MRFHGLFVVLGAVLALLPCRVQAAGNFSISELLPLIPDCALSCILTALSTKPTALSDPESTCRDTSLQAGIAACIQGACKYEDQAKVGVLNSKLCTGVAPDKSRVVALMIVKLTLGPIALIAITLRTYSRYAITKKMGADDWTMLAAGVVLVGVLACSFENVLTNGFGMHYWNLDVTRVTPLLKIFFAAEVFYVLEITLVKISIILFYLRVFPTRWFRILNICMIVAVAIAGVAVLMPIFFQCNPVQGAWDRTIPAKCININLLAYATGGIGVGFDVIILILPVPELWKLKMSSRKKRNVLFMFSLGGIACVTSMVRLKYLADFANSTDQTWDNAIAVIVSLLEICIAIICACLPALRALLSHYIPQLFTNDSTAASRSNYHPPTNASKLEDLKSTTDTRTLVSPGSVLGHSQKGSQSVASPRTLVSVNEKSISSDGSSTIVNGAAWANKAGYITRDCEVVQDIENGMASHDFDGLNPTSIGRKSANTITTKIWTGQSPVKPNYSHQNPLSSHAVEQSSTAYNRSASSFQPNNASDDSFHKLTGLSRMTPTTQSYDDDASIGKRTERTGSEDSIFVLEGPRESDVDMEDHDDNDDERQILERRGRSPAVRASERTPQYIAGHGDIELQNFQFRSDSGVRSYNTSVRSRSESQNRGVGLGLSVPRHGRSRTHTHSLSQTRGQPTSRSRGTSSVAEDRRNMHDDMDVFGHGVENRAMNAEGLLEDQPNKAAPKALHIPISMFNRRASGS